MDKAALVGLVGGWIVKKSPSSPPQKLSEDDCTQLAEAAYTSWAHADDPAKDALRELTREWIAQRERGTVPGRLLEEDFRAIMACLGLDKPKASPQAEPEPEPEPEAEALFPALPAEATVGEWRKDFMPAESLQENEVLPDGRRVRDVLQEDPFYFARLHLALSL